MRRRYAVIVLIVGIALFLSNYSLDGALGRLGLFLVIAVSGALLVDVIRRRRGAGR